MHLVLRVDGGPQIGYGHLVRSSALAEELLDRGHTVTVATATPDPAEEVLPSRTTTTTLPSRADPDSFVSSLGAESPDAVFADAYPVDTDYQRSIRDRVPLVVLQDDTRHAICADLFTNGNLYASNLEYEFAGEEPTMCLGPDYVLLRRAIRELTADDPPWNRGPERALVIMGGGDVRNLTPTVIRAFDGVDLRVDTIVGPGVSEQQEREIREAAGEVSMDIRVARDPDDLPERMFRADFAVSTASSTTYELLALGTPMVSVPVAENQKPIAEALAGRNLATVLDGNADAEAFSTAIRGYVMDSSMRRRRREVGRRLVDGRGVERVCTQVLSLAKKN